MEARRSDIAGLPEGALAGAAVVTASALLDMLTDEDLTELVTACAGAGCPVLLTLSVVGRVGAESRLRQRTLPAVQHRQSTAGRIAPIH